MAVPSNSVHHSIILLTWGRNCFLEETPATKNTFLDIFAGEQPKQRAAIYTSAVGIEAATREGFEQGSIGLSPP